MSNSADRPCLARSVRASLGVLGLIVITVNAAAAQTVPAAEPIPAVRSWEFRVPSGALVPTGEQRHSLKDAHVTAAQLSWVVRPRLALTGTFTWARSRDLASVDAPKLDVFTSDLGVEAHSAAWSSSGWGTARTFAGLGAGVRSYNHRSLDVDATHNLAGYGSVGGELDGGRVGLRLEVRDYVTGMQPLIGAGGSQMRNDVVVMAALSIRWRRAAEGQE